MRRFLKAGAAALALITATAAPANAYELFVSSNCPDGQRWDVSQPVEVVVAYESVLDYLGNRGANELTNAARMLADVQKVIDLYNAIPGSGLELRYGGTIEGSASLGKPEDENHGAQKLVIGFTDVKPASATAEAFAKSDGQCVRKRSHVMFRKSWESVTEGDDGEEETTVIPLQWIFGPPDDLRDAGRAFTTANQPAIAGSEWISFLGVLTHEMGHALGLRHPVSEYAIMAQSFSTWFRGRNNVARVGLLPDDEAGMRALYGDGSGANRVRLSATNTWFRSGAELSARECAEAEARLTAALRSEAEVQAVVDNLPPGRGAEIRAELAALQAATASARLDVSTCVDENAHQTPHCKVSSRGDGWADHLRGSSDRCGTNLARGSDYPTVSNRICPGEQVQLRYTVNNHAATRDLMARAEVWLSRDAVLEVNGGDIRSPDTRDTQVQGGRSMTVGQVFRLPQSAEEDQDYRVFVRLIPHDPATSDSLWRRDADRWDNSTMAPGFITVSRDACG